MFMENSGKQCWTKMSEQYLISVTERISHVCSAAEKFKINLVQLLESMISCFQHLQLFITSMEDIMFSSMSVLFVCYVCFCLITELICTKCGARMGHRSGKKQLDFGVDQTL